MRYTVTKSHVKAPKRRLPLLVGASVIALLITQIIVSNSLATTGSGVSQTEKEIQDLKDENALLREHIASAAALLTVKEKAKELGLVMSSKPVYLESEADVARLLK